MPTNAEGLRASRYPLLPSLTILENDEGTPVFSVVGSARGASVKLEIADLERGYRIADGTWYPVEPTASQEILDLLNNTGANVGPVTSLRSFLAVRKAGAAGGVVDDRLADEALSPLAFTPPADDLPSGVNATLYPYQLAGWRWLKFLLAEVTLSR